MRHIRSSNVYDLARQSSYTSHPGFVAAEACALLAHLLATALNRSPGPANPIATTGKRNITNTTATTATATGPTASSTGSTSTGPT